jgi:replicative DNA helicase
LREMDKLDQAGGESYVIQVLAAVPNASAIQNHTIQLHEKALLRNLISECNEIIARAYDQGRDVQELLDFAERQILQLDLRMATGHFSAIDDAIRAFMNTFEQMEVTGPDGTTTVTLRKQRGIATEYQDLDKMLGGFKAGDLVIIAARPGVGKTALLLNFAQKMALAGRKVGFFSLEMGKEQLAMRMLAMGSSIPTERVDQGNFSDEELERLHAAFTELAALPIVFDDSSTLNIRALRNRARRIVQQHHLDVLMLDYLQLMEGLRPGGDAGRVQEVSEISRGIKQIARELKVPFIVCSQLSRQVEHRQSHRPMLSDLRESGSIEQDADVVMLLYREDYYDRQKGETIGASYASKVEVNIAKHRNGPTGFVYLTYLHPFTRFENFAGESSGFSDF